MAERFFVDEMKRISLKRRLDENDFEKDVELFFPPVNQVVDGFASALSEYLITIANQPVKRKSKQPSKD